MAGTSGPVTDYGYGPKNGPHTWCLTAECAAGRKQSPVNIITKKCEENLEFPKLSLKPLKSGQQMFKKGKHNFSVTFPQEKTACIEGGPLRERYILQQFHFHWGHESKWGSEHHVDGFSYSSEMHLVFLAERYSAQNDALKDPEGLCVLAVFLHAGTKENKGFKELATAIEKSQNASEAVLDTPIDIFEIVPNLSRYYTYEGSLTTPPCSECVRWIVCADPVEISDAQGLKAELSKPVYRPESRESKLGDTLMSQTLAAVFQAMAEYRRKTCMGLLASTHAVSMLQLMRTMHNCNSCETCENFRPPLPLGHRTLIRSFKP